ncbi:MAG: hypothetical protein LW850_21320 [Planctomycetaceae bacterium]|nr:hypothetical protein [Planctomycetaceae bacterium]
MADEPPDRVYSPKNYNRRFVLLAVGLLFLATVTVLLPYSYYNYSGGFQKLTLMVLSLLGSTPVNAAMMWASMQGPGRWRQTLLGIVYLFGLACMVELVSGIFVGFRFEIFLEIDLPVTLMQLMSTLSLIKIVSLISGIEIVDRNATKSPAMSRWTIRRWLWLLIFIAVFVQTSLAQARWYARMLPTPITNSGAIGSDLIVSSVPSESWFSSVELLCMLFLISSIGQTVFPFLLAGWSFSGRRWRLLAIPFLVLAVYSIKLLCMNLMNKLNSTPGWAGFDAYNIDMLLNLPTGEFEIYTALVWFIDVAIASLAFWIGCQWAKKESMD